MPIGPRASSASVPSRDFASRMSFADRCFCRIQIGPMHGSAKTTCSRTLVLPDSSSVPLQPAALELLTALEPVLARWGRWYVFGAQAVIVYRVPRLSADVDVTLALEPDTPERFAREMQAAGFALRVADPDFVRRTRVLPFVHSATGMPLDIVLAGSGLEDEFLDRAVMTSIGATTVPVIHPADLLVAKLLAGRPKDTEDARARWRLHGGELDAARVRRTLHLLEEALSQSDLVSAFEALVQRPSR
jgi:hypothetical protein